MAWVAVQLRTVDAPGAILAGCALNEIVGFWPLVGVTLTVAEDCAFPPVPIAVAIYVVVVVGVTFSEPVTGKVPRPLMVTELALLAFQLSVVDAPLATVSGWAFKVIAGVRGEEGSFCLAVELPPPHPKVGIRTTSKKKNADTQNERRIGILS